MRKFAMVLAVLMAAASAGAHEQITKEEYEATVRRPGFNRHCLHLTDSARGFMAAMAAMNGQKYTTYGTGFSVEVCTPANWIAKKEENARRRYMELRWDDLGEEDKSDVLHIIAYPDRTTNLNVENTVSVAHIVLRHPGDAERSRIIMQPVFTRPFGIDEQNNLGGQKMVTAVDAAFPMDGIAAVRDAKGEFLITVVGEQGEKNFKIKTKHLDDLGLKLASK